MSTEQKPLDLELDDELPVEEVERRKKEVGKKLDEIRVVDMMDATEDQLRLALAQLQRESWKARAEAAESRCLSERREGMLAAAELCMKASEANRAQEKGATGEFLHRREAATSAQWLLAKDLERRAAALSTPVDDDESVRLGVRKLG